MRGALIVKNAVVMGSYGVYEDCANDFPFVEWLVVATLFGC